MIVFASEKDYKQSVINVIEEIAKDRQKQELLFKVWTRHKVQKMLGIGNTKMLTLIKQGHLELTGDGIYITNKSLEEYIKY